MASMAHRIQIHILSKGSLGPAGLTDSSFAVLPCSLSGWHSSCLALLRPPCHGLAVASGGSCSSSAADPWLSRLAQGLPSILCFSAPVSCFCSRAWWWWWDCLPCCKPCEAAEQGWQCLSQARIPVWVTVGQGSAFLSGSWSSSHRASSTSKRALRTLGKFDSPEEEFL